MKTVIYLSSKQVMILTGDKFNSIKKAYRFEFKESCLINGVITNYDVLKKELGDFVKNNKISVKDVTLVLHSSKVINRNISLPSKLREKEIYPLIEKEMYDLTRFESKYYFDYEFNDNIYRSYAIAESLIQPYIDLFKELKFNLKCIIPALESLIDICTELGFMRDKTGAVEFFDGDSVITLLFDKGSFVYSSSSRFMSIPGTLAFGKEVINKCLDLRNVLMSQKSKSVLECVYFCGFGENDLNYIVNNIDLEVKNIDKLDETYLALYGALVRKKGHSLNFLERYNEASRKKDKDTNLLKGMFIPVFLIVVAGLLSIGAIWADNRIQGQIDDINNELSKLIYFEAENTKYEADDKMRELSEFNEFEDKLSTYPYANSNVLKKIEEVAGNNISIHITGFDSESGKLQFDAASMDNQQIHLFIQRLSESEIFHDVSYSGYSYGKQENDYAIHVECTLEGGLR